MFLKKNATGDTLVETVQVLFLTLLMKSNDVLFLGWSARDVALVEIGGTVGDIEFHNLFLGRPSSVKSRIRGRVVALFMHLDIGSLHSYGGWKKTQAKLSMSVKRASFYRYSTWYSYCRSEVSIEPPERKKIALFY